MISSPQAMMPEWQTIETAPLNPVGKANGPWVLIFSKYDHGTYQGRWVASGDSGSWQAKAKEVDPWVMTRITHWMPLPPVPTPMKEEAL